jgi:hypothetical protein
MHYNNTMSETDSNLNPDDLHAEHDLDGIDPNGVNATCCNSCTCGTSHSSVPRP